ncbi:MAG: 50S ribosomal protein L19 [Candidatus Eiseniibacteriota bacterium]|jgi:large subunit ribosomal protein L19
MADLIRMAEAAALRNDIPEVNAGDNITVHVRVSEGGKERIQLFKGDVIQCKGSGARATITVRKISDGVGVERIFPLSSPSVAKIEVGRKGRVRRARLFYLRRLAGKAARIRERRMK